MIELLLGSKNEGNEEPIFPKPDKLEGKYEIVNIPALTLYNFNASWIYNNEYFVVGGWYNQTPQAGVRALNLETLTWRYIGNFPGSANYTKDMRAIYIPKNNTAVLVGGFNNNDIYVFNHRTETWSNDFVLNGNYLAAHGMQNHSLVNIGKPGNQSKFFLLGGLNLPAGYRFNEARIANSSPLAWEKSILNIFPENYDPYPYSLGLTCMDDTGNIIYVQKDKDMFSMNIDSDNQLIYQSSDSINIVSSTIMFNFGKDVYFFGRATAASTALGLIKYEPDTKQWIHYDPIPLPNIFAARNYVYYNGALWAIGTSNNFSTLNVLIKVT